MIDRTCNLRGVVCGARNSTDFDDSWRRAHKRQSHRIMRRTGGRLAQQLLQEMRDDEETMRQRILAWEREDLRQHWLWVRRERYRLKKIEKQVRLYVELTGQLAKLLNKAEPEVLLAVFARPTS